MKHLPSPLSSILGWRRHEISARQHGCCKMDGHSSPSYPVLIWCDLRCQPMPPPHSYHRLYLYCCFSNRTYPHCCLTVLDRCHPRYLHHSCFHYELYTGSWTSSIFSIAWISDLVILLCALPVRVSFTNKITLHQ